MTHNATWKGITGNAMVGHWDWISNPDESPKSENEDTITDFLRFSGETRGKVGFKTGKRPIQNAFMH